MRSAEWAFSLGRNLGAKLHNVFRGIRHLAPMLLDLGVGPGKRVEFTLESGQSADELVTFLQLLGVSDLRWMISGDWMREPRGDEGTGLMIQTLCSLY